MKSADPYPVIPGGIAGIQALGMAKAVGSRIVKSHNHVTLNLTTTDFFSPQITQIFADYFVFSFGSLWIPD